MVIAFDVLSPSAVNNERLAIVLGFLTLLFALTTFFSCRTFMNLLKRIGLKNSQQNKIFRGFYKYHAYYWWAFGVALLTHLSMALLHTGLPQAGDPDARIHWAILVLGFTGGISGITIFSSCRVLPRLIAPGKKNFSLENSAYGAFFSYHAYYWVVFMLLAAAHFAAGYYHAGIWPR